MMKTAAVTLFALSSSLVDAQSFEYENEGRWPVSEIQTVRTKLPRSECRDEIGVCDVTIDAYVPEGEGPFPLVVVSPGFTLPHDQYKSYARHMATWGYVTVRWTPTENPLVYIRHRARGNMVDELINWAEANLTPEVVDTRRVMVWGHSAGGKSSTLAAVNNPRVVGLVGVDPVDCPPPLETVGPEFPISALQLPDVTAKTLWLGAEYGPREFFGQACGPAICNFPHFHNNATQSWEVELLGTGHMQFLDDKSLELPAAFCVAGDDNKDAIANDITKTLSVAMAEHTIKGVDISEYTGDYINQKVAEGLVKSDLKNFDTAVKYSSN